MKILLNKDLERINREILSLKKQIEINDETQKESLKAITELRHKVNYRDGYINDLLSQIKSNEQTYNEDINRLSKDKQATYGRLGGFKKEINKLHKIIEEKDKEIEDLKRKVENQFEEFSKSRVQPTAKEYITKSKYRKNKGEE